MEEVSLDRCDAYCLHCLGLGFLLQMTKWNLVTAGTPQLANVVFVKDAFRSLAL